MREAPSPKVQDALDHLKAGGIEDVLSEVCTSLAQGDRQIITSSETALALCLLASQAVANANTPQLYVVVDGIEAPDKPSYGPRNRRWHFEDMPVGGSTLVSAEDIGSVRATLVRIGKRLGRKFATEAEGQNFRVWRLSDPD